MNKYRCNCAEIFALPMRGLLPDYLVKDFYMVYSPLADSAVILSWEQWKQLRMHVDDGVVLDEPMGEIAASLLDCDSSKLEESRIQDQFGFRNLTILPTNKCNFSCGFCYSAKGRSSEVLDKQKAFTALDFFVRSGSRENLTLSILGGGEPLLSWELVREIILYAERRASALERTLRISITTNGSLLTDEIILFLKEHRITTVVSYEVLESVQNLHRGHFELVRGKIKRMFELGYRPQFNTVITPENVLLLSEVVQTAYQDFPGIRYICTDPVILPELYHSVDELKAYHDQFIEGFFKAKELGRSLGIKVDCTANLSMDCTMTRYCPGEMGLSAHGLITVCPCVSSEKEPHFNDFIYGRVDADGMHVDEAKLQALLREDVYTSERCVDCAMKYNCAGGCMHKNRMLTPAFKEETCRFTYEFGRYFLFDKLNRALVEEYGRDIKKMLEDEANQ